MPMEKDMGKPLICAQCGLNFALETCLAAHKTIEHYQKPPHSCSVCKIAFFSAIAYNDHLVRHSLQRESPTSYYVCSECGLDFPSEHGMRVHLSTHTGLSLKSRGNANWKQYNKFITCKYCPAVVAGKKRYQQHLKVHLEKTLFPCDRCQQTYEDEASLAAHKQQHEAIEGFASQILSKMNG